MIRHKDSSLSSKVEISILPLENCVKFKHLFNISVLLFCHLYNRFNNST